MDVTEMVNITYTGGSLTSTTQLKGVVIGCGSCIKKDKRGNLE